jgi:hypothetical protein
MTLMHIVAPVHGAHPVDLPPLEVDAPEREKRERCKARCISTQAVSGKTHFSELNRLGVLRMLLILGHKQALLALGGARAQARGQGGAWLLLPFFY